MLDYVVVDEDDTDAVEFIKRDSIQYRISLTCVFRREWR